MKISYSMLADYIFCPYYFWLNRIAKIKAPPTLEMIFGLAIHKIIHKFLYRKIEDYPEAGLKRIDEGEHIIFYYKEVGGLINTWLKLWGEYLGEIEPEMLTQHEVPEKIWFPEDMPQERKKELKNIFMGTGVNMLKAYYYLNIDKPRPFLLEEELSAPVWRLDPMFEELGGGIEITGKLDQARKDKQGRAYVVDDKTGWDSFLNPKREAPTLEAQREILRKAVHRKQEKPRYRPLPKQAPLAFNLQLTIYYLLFRAWYGYAPYKVGLHYLRNDHLYLTDVKENHIEELKRHLRYFLDALENENFPRLGIKTRSCRYCTLSKECLGKNRNLIEPISIVEMEEPPPSLKEIRAEIQATLERKPHKLKLNLKRRRQKKDSKR